MIARRITKKTCIKFTILKKKIHRLQWLFRDRPLTTFGKKFSTCGKRLERKTKTILKIALKAITKCGDDVYNSVWIEKNGEANIDEVSGRNPVPAKLEQHDQKVGFSEKSLNFMKSLKVCLKRVYLWEKSENMAFLYIQHFCLLTTFFNSSRFWNVRKGDTDLCLWLPFAITSPPYK